MPGPTKREARAAYEVFVRELPLRLAEWKQHVEATGGPKAVNLDGSRESINAVADWVERQYQSGVTIGTLADGWAAYLAECIQLQVPQATWVFYEGPDAAQHRPILTGFSMPFDVRHVAGTSLRQFLKTQWPVRPERTLDALEQVYDAWIDGVVHAAPFPVEATPGITLVEVALRGPIRLPRLRGQRSRCRAPRCSHRGHRGRAGGSARRS